PGLRITVLRSSRI
ncbi:hypothetical protein MPH_02975, partial [Macrophomina phaseolina MS6]